MTEQQNFGFNSTLLGKRTVIGAGIAFSLIAGFIGFMFLVVGGSFEAGLWIALPLLTVTVAGAFGGAAHYLLDLLLKPRDWMKVLFNTGFMIVYLIGLWLSLIIAFALLGFWD